jgi:hypothetical protein
MSRPSPSRPDRTPASGEEIRVAEGESGTTINKNVTILTGNDIAGLTPRPDINVPTTTVTVNYTVRKIPVPSTNNIRVLSASSKIWNVPKLVLEDENGNFSYVTNEDNIITQSGDRAKVRVHGDNGAVFKLVIRDTTNTKWYNWETEEFESGYNDIESTANSGGLNLSIPPQEIETIYNVFLKSIGSTSYDSYLPTESNPWVINQLPNPSTTLKFQDGEGYVSEQTTIKTHSPGVVLNAGSINDGKITVNITTIPTKGSISIKNSTIKANNIHVTDNETVVVGSDLTASVSGRVGTITGTIVVGKSSKRNTDILFYPNDFFTIT